MRASNTAQAGPCVLVDCFGYCSILASRWLVSPASPELSCRASTGASFCARLHLSDGADIFGGHGAVVLAAPCAACAGAGSCHLHGLQLAPERADLGLLRLHALLVRLHILGLRTRSLNRCKGLLWRPGTDTGPRTCQPSCDQAADCQQSKDVQQHLSGGDWHACLCSPCALVQDRLRACMLVMVAKLGPEGA